MEDKTKMDEKTPPEDLDLDAFFAGSVVVLASKKVTVGRHRLTLNEVPTKVWWRARDIFAELENVSGEDKDPDAASKDFEAKLLEHDSLLLAASLLRREPTEPEREMVIDKFGAGTLGELKADIMELSGRSLIKVDAPTRSEEDPLPNASDVTEAS